jgi:pyruvyl transferase EpsO
MNLKNNLPLETPQDLKRSLHQALANIPDFKRCALLDYPSHLNIGDHLIWLGSIFYITQTRQAQIDYVSPMGKDFSAKEFAGLSKEGPIFLHGGGNFGDFWPGYQNFREKIVSEYQGRPIVVLPQTIYFSSEAALARSAKIFNQHPDVTIFARDDRSLAIAREAFYNCKLYKAPDMAFQLVGLPKIPQKRSQSPRILYLCRTDAEINDRFRPEKLKLDGLDVQDWVSYTWITRKPGDGIRIPGSVRLTREGWQRGLKTPKEWLSRQNWKWLHPSGLVFNQVHASHLHRISWEYMHSGIWQLQAYDLVITNRLHVHILCLILDIPHILLPGSYYKIPAFYQTWTENMPACCLVENVDEVYEAVEALRQKYRSRALSSELEVG